jgi:hypothetical protein
MTSIQTKPIRKPVRVLRIWFEITDDAGHTRPYTVIPAQVDGALMAYRLTRYSPDRSRSEIRYLCAVNPEGSAWCNCPGFKTGACKHVACLQRAGMLPFDVLLQCRDLTLQLDQLMQPKKWGNPWGC